jgi:integrase
VLFRSDCGDLPERDRAIISIAAHCGLRREEISSLDFEDIRWGDSPLFAVRGKGSKLRDVFIPKTAWRDLEAWLTVTKGKLGPIFWRGRKGGKIAPGRRLSPSGVWEVIKRAALAAKIENVTPHDFRRTYASMLFAQGVDPVTVQKLMGHEDPKTTANYDRRGDSEKIAAADAIARALKEE